MSRAMTGSRPSSHMFGPNAPMDDIGCLQPIGTSSNKPIHDHRYERSNSSKSRNNWGSPECPEYPICKQESKSQPPVADDLDVNCGYIVTPGRHRIDISEFLMAVDAATIQQQANTNPAATASASYSQDMHTHWRRMEQLINPNTFMLSYPEGCDVEEFRMMAIQCIFNYAVAAGLCCTTVHMAVMNINRLLYHRIHSVKQPLTEELFACTVVSALRAAIKFEEKPEKVDRIRVNPADIWRASGFCEGITVDRSVEKLNKLESESLQILEHPMSPPVSPEFLERYLVVGAWPEYTSHYRELASFLLGLALFTNGKSNPLKGVPPSKLAAAALVLAVKVINTDASLKAYEFWPRRLESYTHYTLKDLRPVVRGISILLRSKPLQTKILEKFFPKWGAYDWN